MAQQAWLDSLSEDWVSQPRSNESQVDLEPLSSPGAEGKQALRDRGSRIPRPNTASNVPASPYSNALNERSASEINFESSSRISPRSPRRAKSNLPQNDVRSGSMLSNASVVHNTINHNLASGHPLKGTDNIPEWKRRLVYGELPYGESRDLFSSAGNGLEDMFRPPKVAEPVDDDHEEMSTMNDMTLPSSPPPYRRRAYLTSEQHDLPADMSGPADAVSTDSVRQSHQAATNDSHKNYHSNSSADMDSSFTSISAKPSDKPTRVISGASGQSVIQHEDLSPIVLSRHDDSHGRYTYAPLDASAEQLKKRLEKLRRNQLVLDNDPQESASRPLGVKSETTAPGGFNTTDDFINGGGFLNVKRGGRSGEGSFLRRPLSPPLNTDTSEMLPESSLQASTPKHFPTVRNEWTESTNTETGAHRPSTPDHPPALRPGMTQAQHGASQNTSPLKLFGPYDTFTNQTLLRRISQFEDPMSDSLSQADSIDESYMENMVEKLYREEEAQGEPRSSKNKPSHGDQQDARGSVNAFGVGELNDFEFSEDLSFSREPSILTNKENIDPTQNQVAQEDPRFDIHEDLHSDTDTLNVDKHRKWSNAGGLSRYSRQSSWSSHTRRSRSTSALDRMSNAVLSTPKRESSEGKRPRTSPSKDPTPKRRRTLHKSDVAFGLVDLADDFDLIYKSHDDLQDAVGRKRKIATPLSGQLSINPAISALRQTVRPRSPTPSQRNSAAKDRRPLGEVEYGTDAKEHILESGKNISATPNWMLDGSRKTSMKTQDFWEQANEIMAMIRSKARPKTSLDSVEESEVEHGDKLPFDETIKDDESYQSTEEPFSRPPSRDGRPLARMPLRQEDPEVADRLKQYAELSDLGELVSLSMGRIKEANHEFNMAKESIDQSLRDSASRTFSSPGPEFISDLPNIRLSRNPDGSTALYGEEHLFPGTSYGSRASSGRSYPSSSSRNSESCRLIAPDAVTQLIGEQVGNMVFDKGKNAWMKVKTPNTVAKVINVLPSDDSEEDPFASIPDLSVDMTMEKENLLGLSAGSRPSDIDNEQGPGSPHFTTATEHGSCTPVYNGSPVLSPRATPNTNQGYSPVSEAESVEHEITIDEDRISKTPSARRRNLTITFSSPIASILRNLPALDDDDLGVDPIELTEAIRETTSELGANRPEESAGLEHVGGKVPPKSRSRSRGPARMLSVRGRAFITRPVSRIDERDETSDLSDHAEERQLSMIPDLSLVGGDANEQHISSLGVTLTPVASRTTSISTTPAIAKHVGTLSLSPLPDFTMLQADQSCALEISYVVEDRYLVTGNKSKKTLSTAIRSLVEKITEAEPFEPDWKGMQELDISDKKLASLHMLDEFCGGVVTLEASNNNIRHLEGVPDGVRNLRITHNQLSELTAWGHLMNLQYVDVSNNHLTSLFAFKGLVHLRSLRADNNRITSLQGICQHDTLQVLRARGNMIKFLDFDGTRLDRLSELDLEHNRIEAVHNIEQLPSLTSLNLQHNQLTEISTSPGTTTETVRFLKVSDNNIVSLDLSGYPSIRLLHADRNQIAIVKGGARCRRLDSLSLREQKIEGYLDTSFLTEVYEIRKLFLSGNLLGEFDPSVDFLNLQYLELANCGLQSLPENLGQLMPNVRVLNLNFNALSDLSSLRFIPRLKKLSAAGNRLAEAGQIANALADFPHLSKLDLRDNPTTQGFYPPLQTLVYVNETGDKPFDPFVLPEGSAERDGQFVARLDTGTRMRRRLYEMVVLGQCQRLKSLDGLDVRRADVAKKDATWSALSKAGVLGDIQARRNTEAEKMEEHDIPKCSIERDEAQSPTENRKLDLPHRPVTPVRQQA
ncbi:protein NUD1 [Microdochium nivale]|nr:protein NUD1 [Microdochium nivale]